MARKHISHWNHTITVMRERGENIGEQLHELSCTSESLAISIAHEPDHKEYHKQLANEMQALLNVIHARLAA